MSENGIMFYEMQMNDDNVCDYTWGYRSCLIARIHRYIDEV